MTATDRRRNRGRRAVDRILEGSGRTSSRTANLIALLRSPEWAKADPDEVADHLLRLDVLRIDARAKLDQQRTEWGALVDDLEARLEASQAVRQVVAGDLRRLADDPHDLLAGDTAAHLLRLAGVLDADGPAPSANAESGG